MTRSSNSPISSRVFTARMMKNALLELPSSQSRNVRKLARKLHKRTGMGYYAALDTIATIGIHVSLLQPSTKST